MSLLKFISSLSAVFEKNDILEKCTLTKTSIREHALPSYSAATELFKGQKFKSDKINKYDSVFSKEVGRKAGVGMVGAILSSLENSISILDVVSEYSKKNLSEHEASVALTYTKATLLRLAELMEYVNTYSLKFLNYIYIEESKSADTTIDLKVSPAEEKWLDDGFMDFCKGINVSKMNVDAIKKHLNEMPDANITEATERVFPTTIGQKRTDPFGFNNLSTKYHPFYRIGMFIADYQATKYKSAQQEVQQLQLQNLYLTNLLAKKPDAKIEKQIAYNQGRISDMNYRLSSMEKDYELR